MKNTKKTLTVFLMLSTILFWIGCEKAPIDNPHSGKSSYRLVMISGNNQIDTINKQLNQALKVQIQDSLGIAYQGEAVTFSISSGGGSLSALNVTTDANGFAEAFWTLGSIVGNQAVSVTANVTQGNPQNFSAIAISSSGGSAGCSSSFTDARDGQVYCQVTIGNQTWMAENLRYNVLGTATLDTLNSSNPSTNYGRLYDWATVMNGAVSSNGNPSGVQGICPNGWHLPSNSEWNELEIALGMNAADTAIGGFRGTHGTAIKSGAGWINGNGTGSSGFNALPTGYYETGLGFLNQDDQALFWSSTSSGLGNVYFRALLDGNVGVFNGGEDLTNGFSCRCIKD